MPQAEDSPEKEYRPWANGLPIRVIRYLQAKPNGSEVSTRQIGIDLNKGVVNGICASLKSALRKEWLVNRRTFLDGERHWVLVWSLGPKSPPDNIESTSREEMIARRREETAAERMRERLLPRMGPFVQDAAGQIDMTGRPQETPEEVMRDFFRVGNLVPFTDPTREVLNALDTARLVLSELDKQRREGRKTRFLGAEVELVVTREIKYISEIAIRARQNLLEALAVMEFEDATTPSSPRPTSPYRG